MISLKHVKDDEEHSPSGVCKCPLAASLDRFGISVLFVEEGSDVLGEEVAPGDELMHGGKDASDLGLLGNNVLGLRLALEAIAAVDSEAADQHVEYCLRVLCEC